MQDIRPESGQATPPPFRPAAATAPIAAPAKARVRLNHWRLLRLVFVLQGLYYLVTGAWPLLVRVAPLPALFSATSLGGGFAGTLVQALTALLGVVLLLAVARSKPDGLLVGLGAGAAAIFFLTELRFRSALHGLVYADMVLEAVFFLALGLCYLSAIVGDRRRR